jgi:nucleotide-binding universal stress UspA family protein
LAGTAFEEADMEVRAASQSPLSGRAGPSPSYVVVAVDGTADGRRAIRFGAAEAVRRGTGLRLVHVQAQTMPVAPMLPGVPVETLHDIGAGVVKDAEQEARRCGWDEPELDVVLSNGPRRRAILEHTADAACVVVGRRGSSLDHLRTGSTTASLAAHSDVPVISVPESWDPGEEHRRVVAGVDVCAGEGERGIVWAAIAEGLRRHASVEVMHAWRPTGAYDAVIGARVLQDEWRARTDQQLVEQVSSVAASKDVAWRVSAQYTRPILALHRASERADLLVVGRHGHESAVRPFLGATARATVRVASCPVMVVPTGPARLR